MFSIAHVLMNRKFLPGDMPFALMIEETSSEFIRCKMWSIVAKSVAMLAGSLRDDERATRNVRQARPLTRNDLVLGLHWGAILP